MEEGHEVVVIDNLSSGKVENLSKEVKFYRMDIQDRKLEACAKSKVNKIIFVSSAAVYGEPQYLGISAIKRYQEK